jgi:hypothetical protein
MACLKRDGNEGETADAYRMLVDQYPSTMNEKEEGDEAERVQQVDKSVRSFCNVSILNLVKFTS